jgi:hypothetical protein
VAKSQSDKYFYSRSLFCSARPGDFPIARSVFSPFSPVFFVLLTFKFPFAQQNLDIYIYKNSIKTSDIGLTAHVGDSKTKFEIWFRKRKPGDTWTLQSMSEDVKNTWANEISNLLWNQAKRNREVRMAEMSSMGIGSKPCLDIRPSIDQINDRSISIFQLGKGEKVE